MRLVIKLTLVAVLCLNSITQIDGFPGLSPLRKRQNDDFDEHDRLLIEWFKHLETDDQPMVRSIVKLAPTLARRSCKECDETPSKADDDYFNAIEEMYPMLQAQSDQLLKKSDNADQMMLKEIFSE